MILLDKNNMYRYREVGHNKKIDIICNSVVGFFAALKSIAKEYFVTCNVEDNLKSVLWVSVQRYSRFCIQETY